MAKFNIKTVKPKFVVTTAPETKIDVSINRPIITAKNQKAYFKLKNTGGPKGDKGDTGDAATITVGSTSTGAPGSNASVANVGTSSAAVLNFTIPRGDKGDKGDTGATGSPGAAATVTVGATTTGQPGTNASVVNAGTQSAAVLNFTIPKGAKGDTGATGSAATVAVGTTTTGQPGTNASVTNSGTQSAAVLNFTIPKGAKGDTGSAGAAATIAAGTTTTGQPGTSASVTNVGTSSAAIFDFTIPKGDKGDQGNPGAAATVTVGSTQTGGAGTSASVVNSGTSSAAVLDFTIPKGDKGDTGSPGSAATIAVGTVTTLQPNQSAYVTNVGTSSAAVFDIGIPKGEQGQAGSGSGDMLAADYDPNGTVQNAGGIVAYVASEVPTKTSELLNDGSDGMAAYLETDETAYRTASIPYGVVDNTSTSTAFTATVPGITALRDGVCVWLKNGVVTSAAGFTININGLGAKPVYSNMAAASAESTMFNVNYTFMFVYDSTRVAGGCWILNRGYNSNDNTIGYQIRTNSQSLPASDAFVRYRLLFTSADGTKYVPATTSTSTNATASRTVNQTKINPFGRIFYYSSTTAIAQGNRPGATVLWEQYTLVLGYSFNRTGAALTLTSWKPVYIKCAPQTDGSAIIDSTTPYVQDLPTTEDGKIYIFLGIAYDATHVELQLDHPVYYYKGGQIRLWTNAQALATVATSGSYNDLTNKPTIPAAQVNSDWNANSGVAEILNKPTIPTVNDATLTINQNGVQAGTFTANASSNATISLTDTTYSTMTGATSGADGASGLVPKPSAGDQDKVLSGAGTWVSQPEMAVLSYGHSTWAEFTAAYADNRVVFCRASLNADPGTGDQTRLAPLTYVDSENNPTSVQFHFHRSLVAHTDAQQGDQVIVYTLDSTNGGTWSVDTREDGTRVVAGANMTSWYNSGVLTLNSAQPAPVDHTSSVTPGTNVTIDAGGKVISIGKIVIVNMNIVTSATVYAYSTLLSSIPMRNPDNFLWLSMVDANNANKMYRAYYQSGSGEIRTRDQLPAGTYGLSFVYITS